MDELDATRAAYDTVAAAYAARFSDELDAKPFDRALLTAFAELLQGRGEVADLGCGPGHVGAFLHDLGLPVLGVDLSPAMIDIATAAYPDLRFRVGSMLDLDLPDASLAGVVAFYSIIHTPTERLPRLFAEVHRVLSPGGRALFAFQTGTGEAEHRGDADWLGHRVTLTAWWRPPDDVVRLLADAGLTVHARLLREPDENEARTRAYVFARKGEPGMTHRA
jgi:SAM-dependent methyltransferase